MTQFEIPNIGRLIPMKGVCYSPAPSDDAPRPPEKYFDTDFTNSSFPEIWGAGSDGTGRNDVKSLKEIGVNFMHLYDWSVPSAPGATPNSFQRSHLSYLKALAAADMTAMVPISNWFVKEIAAGKSATTKQSIFSMVREVYDNGATPVPGAGMWGVANEYDLNPFSAKDVATAMQYIVEAEIELGIRHEDTLPVTSPVSFATHGHSVPAVQAIKDLQSAIKANPILGPADFLRNRFVASLNPFVNGEALATYIAEFPGNIPDTPFFFAEMGINLSGTKGGTEADQAKFVADQLAHTAPSGNFLGRCVFQFLNQTAMKTGQEATWGMTKFSSPSTFKTKPILPENYQPGGSYRVDDLTEKPLWSSVKAAYQA